MAKIYNGGQFYQTDILQQKIKDQRQDLQMTEREIIRLKQVEYLLEKACQRNSNENENPFEPLPLKSESVIKWIEYSADNQPLHDARKKVELYRQKLECKAIFHRKEIDLLNMELKLNFSKENKQFTFRKMVDQSSENYQSIGEKLIQV